MPTLQINDTKLVFSVSGYSWQSDWTDDILEVENRYLKYKNSDEILERVEVDRIIKTLYDLLDDKLKKTGTVIFYRTGYFDGLLSN